MKKKVFAVCFCSSIVFFSCKKEINQPETIKTIKFLVTNKSLTREKIEKEVSPLITKLYEQDSVKYRMINHISNKAKLQTNKTVFLMNMENLKEELKYVK